MAMTTVPQFPLFWPTAYSGGSVTSFAMDTTDDWVAFPFYWPGGDLLECAIYPTASASGVVTLQVFDSDAADGTTTPVLTGSPRGSAVDSGTLVANTPSIITGLANTGLAAGFYAMRAILKSGTCTIREFISGEGTPGVSQGLPYVVTVTNGGAQTRVNTLGGISLAVGGSAFVPLLGSSPPVTFSLQSFTSASSPNEYGLWFTNPAPISLRVCGFYARCQNNSRPDVLISMYSGTLSGGVVSSPSTPFGPITFDRDQSFTITAATFNFFPFSTGQTITAGGQYGLGIRAGTAQNWGLEYWDFGSGNEGLMAANWGANATMFSRVGGAGDLTQVATTKTPMIFPVIDGMDAGAGGGGSVPLSRPTIFWE